MSIKAARSVTVKNMQMIDKIDKQMIKGWSQERKCRFRFYGDKPSLLIVGERHEDKEHQALEEELIQLIKPPYLLHEFLGARIYNPTTKEAKFFFGTSINAMDQLFQNDIEAHLLTWAEKYKMPLVGIDCSFAELDIIADKIKQRKPSHEPTTQTLEECIYRERRMGEKIAEHCKKVKEMLIAMVGSNHIRPSSRIHSILQKKKIEYICISLPKNKDR